MPHLLVAVSSHGYGHAAQTAPVVNALRVRHPDLRLTIRSQLPRAFLASRFEGDFEQIPGGGDFGLAMRSALAGDLAGSAARYAELHSDWPARAAAEAQALARLKPDLVLANISYLVLAAAQAAAIPAVGLCSFTWAQIYAYYFERRPEAASVLRQMRDAYAAARAILWLEPGIPLDLPNVRPVGVIARRGEDIGAELRRHLGLPGDTRLIVVSLGGIDHALALSAWPRRPDVHWLVPRAIHQRRGDISAQEDLPFHFTDLLASADVLITKPGYGAFTEAACNATPVLYVPREDWPEQPFLVDWLRARRHPVACISPAELCEGRFAPALEAVRSATRPAPFTPSGAECAAEFLSQYL